MTQSRHKNIEAVYPLSPMQAGMLFHSIMEPDNGVYFEQTTFKVKGRFDAVAFKKAVQKVISRNPVLRTAFVYKKLEQQLQVVHKSVELPVSELDWSGVPEEKQLAKFEELLAQDRRMGFNLSKAPLLRLTIVQLNEQTWQILWSNHHILFDGWSLPILLKELFAFYEAYGAGREISLPLQRPFRDYILWLQKQDMDKARAFWKKHLHGFYAPTPLPLRHIKADAHVAVHYPKIKYEFSKATSESLKNLARKNQVTLNTLVQSAWAIILSRYSREDDVIFGATVSGRPPELSGVENMPGLFINTLPIRVRIDPRQSFMQLCKELQKTAVEQREYEYSPLPEIQAVSEVPAQLPLFESIVVFENYPVDQTMSQQKISLELTDVQTHEQTNYPLTVVAGAHTHLVVELAYDAGQLSTFAAEHILKRFRILLNTLASQPDIRIKDVDLLDNSEREEQTISWNQTAVAFAENKCIHQIFEQMVQNYPSAAALKLNDQMLTYEQLNVRANKLARLLLRSGLGAEDRVVIFMERSFDMITSILAVFKAGGAYVPIDTTYPQERIEYILQDCGAGMVLTDGANRNRLSSAYPGQIISVSTTDKKLAELGADNPEIPVDSRQLAYMIYTSGSTGRPKGTLLQHHGAINTAAALKDMFRIGPGKSLLQFASLGFDASVAEILAALLSGSCLHLVDRETILSDTRLGAYLKSLETSSIVVTPSVLAIMNNEDLPALESVVSAGEACTRDVAERWSQTCTFTNGYGPTESTVAASCFIYKSPAFDGDIVPIGRPIQNVRLYVLDPYLNIQPVGAPGELHIASPGLARGYLHRPDLTAEKFIPDPFSGQAGSRMYRSGDLVRFQPDGNLEFLGRIDHQVKIRGFRIELGEIEGVLKSHPLVRDAAVKVVQDSNQQERLVAWYVAESEENTGEEDLASYLKKQLPDYMVPQIFVSLSALPLTSSGKVDRRALPLPEDELMISSQVVEPRTPVEELLVTIWTQILKVARISIDDSFFDLGGHSLLATQLMSRLRDAFGVEIALRDFFGKPTIADLALAIEQARIADQGPEIPALKKMPRTDIIPASFAQQRLWFLDQLAPGQAFYNIPAAIRLQGTFDETVFARSLQKIVSRHESLRTIFKNIGGDPCQEILPRVELNIIHHDLSSLDEQAQEEEAKRLAKEEAAQPFNLAAGPLFRIKILKMGETERIVLFTLHHAISDGWSMGVMVNELARLYRSYLENSEDDLPDLNIQYADFAIWQREWLKDEVLQQQIDFWKKELQGAPPVLELPTDHPRPAVQTFNGQTVHFRLSSEQSARLKAFNQKNSVTPFMSLLALFQTLLHRYSRQDIILVGSPIANRTRSETEALIGFFVNTLVLKADFGSRPDFRTLVRQVREHTLQAYAHQDLPFEQLVEALQPEREMSHSPVFQVAFILQNAPFEAIELPGLTISPFEAESQTAKYDLTLYATEGEDGIGLSLEYNCDLFEETTIRRMQKHLSNLLDAALSDPKKPVHQIDFLDTVEKQQMLSGWNETRRDFPRSLTVNQIFEDQVSKNPEATALIMASRQITYGRLNEQANQLARYLRKMDIGPDDLVGISMERSTDIPLSMLAILKAGAGFLNIDPTYPEERIQYMLRDSGIKCLLTHRPIVPSLPDIDCPVVFLDEPEGAWKSFSSENLLNISTADNLAYVIYTSGSTGRPKGTMLSHRGLNNLARTQQRAFNIQGSSRILQFAPLSFDASVWETVMALLNGATLVLSDQESLSTGQGLLSVLEENKVSTVTLPPSVLAVVPEHPLPDLRTIVTAGEKCTIDLVRRWADGRQFVNAYGPTETTVCASMYQVHGQEKEAPPIGRPIDNFQLYILDANWNVVPVGVPGELCVAGVGLARGYLNRPDLTADVFIPNPFSDTGGERLYRTGDLVRYLPDGTIEFLGRIDHQVKLRGFRIEPGEIESILVTYDSINDAAVIVREDRPGVQRLVGYYVTDKGNPLDSSAIKQYLRRLLPEYMVPTLLIHLAEMPLSPSGKVDRNALPRPDSGREGLDVAFIAPASDTEKKLAEIVCNLLQLDRVGIRDNFFDLGGHSLLATRFISRIREEFGVELPLRKLFEEPTIEGIAAALHSPEARAAGSEQPQIEKLERSSESIDDLVDKIDQLSDEEIRALLESEEKNDQQE